MSQTADLIWLKTRREELKSQLGTTRVPLLIDVQNELAKVNAKIKLINITIAADAKATADKRKIAGQAEYLANLRRSDGSGPFPVLPQGASKKMQEWFDARPPMMLFRMTFDEPTQEPRVVIPDGAGWNSLDSTDVLDEVEKEIAAIRAWLAEKPKQRKRRV